MSPPSSRSNASSTPATPRPGSCATPARRPSTSRTRRSLPPAPPKLSVRTGKSKTPPITAATSPWARIVRASAPTPACSPACAASPSTSSKQTRPTRSARTATAPVSQASKTCFHSSSFESVEQPCRVRRPWSTMEHHGELVMLLELKDGLQNSHWRPTCCASTAVGCWRQPMVPAGLSARPTA